MATVAAAVVLAAAAVVEAIERLLNSFKSSATFKHVTSTCAQSQWQRKRRRAAMMAVSSVMASVAAAVATVAAAVVSAAAAVVEAIENTTRTMYTRRLMRTQYTPMIWSNHQSAAMRWQGGGIGDGNGGSGGGNGGTVVLGAAAVVEAIARLLNSSFTSSSSATLKP